ncbi:MAG: ABC transporter substrate-binding protein [Chloroflexi bacterium]|nr:ABC transporter substrate-binding protein [Chloroflexota bacterium]
MRGSACLVITALVVLGLVTACAPTEPTKPAAPAPTVVPAAPTKPAAPTATPAPKIKRGGTARVGRSADFAPNLDPHQFTAPLMGLDVIFNALLKGSRDEKTGQWKLGPWLAESWELPNPKTVVFKLRKGVTFHDGSALDAKVVKWNLDRMRTHPKSAAKTDFEKIESVDVLDDYTVRLNLKTPPAGLLGLLSDLHQNYRGAIISQATVEKQGDEFITRNPVGSGPMTFVEWKSGSHMTVKKWDKYWEKGEDGQSLPYLDGITYRFIADPTVLALELRTGNLELGDEIQVKDFPAVKADPNLQLVEFEWSSVVQYIFFNMKKPPFGNNLKLRQAALYALDHENMAKAIGMEAGRPAYYFWDKGVLGYDDTLPRYNYQPDKAKQLVKEAGFSDGVSVNASFFTQGAIPRTAEATKQMWDAVGIKTTLEVLERAAAVAKWQTGGHEVALSQRPSSVMDPDDDAYRIVTGGVFNFAQWENKELDKCMEEGRSIIEEAKRAEIYKRCQRIIYEDAPYGQSWSMPRNVVVSKKLKGFEAHRFLGALLGRAWLDK